MPSASIGCLENNNNRVKTITAPSADSNYFPIQVPSIFVMDTNEKKSARCGGTHLWRAAGRVISMCMLKGHSE